jgi:hypothetical protein
VKHPRWIPHTLTPTQKTERATLSIELLCQLRSIEHQSWQFMMTIDESWFYLSTNHEQTWLRLEERAPEKPRHTIQDPKIMVVIARSPLGFHLLDALPKGSTCNAEGYRANILTELLPLRPQGDGRRVAIHADNARPDTARKYQTFCKKIRSSSPYIHRTHLILHHPTSFSSDMSNVACRE